MKIRCVAVRQSNTLKRLEAKAAVGKPSVVVRMPELNSFEEEQHLHLLLQTELFHTNAAADVEDNRDVSTMKTKAMLNMLNSTTETTKSAAAPYSSFREVPCTLCGQGVALAFLAEHMRSSCVAKPLFDSRKQRTLKKQQGLLASTKAEETVGYTERRAILKVMID